MAPVRRLLIILLSLAVPLVSAAPDALALRRSDRHTARTVIAVYRVAARRHASHRLHAAAASTGRLAQLRDVGLILDS